MTDGFQEIMLLLSLMPVELSGVSGLYGNTAATFVTFCITLRETAFINYCLRNTRMNKVN